MARTNRDLVMLADDFIETKHRAAGMYLSEKLDGMRCLWLPTTRGQPIGAMPFANVSANGGKDSRDHLCTGLWSRYGKVIHCPQWFVEGFPDFPVDGELYAGRGTFEDLMSTVKTLVPDDYKWRSVKFMIFDAPPYDLIFADGKINSPQYKIQIDQTLCLAAINAKPVAYNDAFEFRYRRLLKELVATPCIQLHKQELTQWSTPLAVEQIKKKLDEVTDTGGEGLILRHPASGWEPIRSRFMLKVKKLKDAEGKIVAFNSGLGKYLGMMGSMVINWPGGQFELSGFTDEERELTPESQEWARMNPGQLMPHNTKSKLFKVGQIVNFKYRELTQANAPKEARFNRKL